jgi:hypothetical protein
LAQCGQESEPYSTIFTGALGLPITSRPRRCGRPRRSMPCRRGVVGAAAMGVRCVALFSSFLPQADGQRQNRRGRPSSGANAWSCVGPIVRFQR